MRNTQDTVKIHMHRHNTQMYTSTKFSNTNILSVIDIKVTTSCYARANMITNTTSKQVGF